MVSSARHAENLTGGMDFWIVRTTVEIAQTGITYPVEQANPDGNWPFFIHGTTFANETAYNIARQQQRNFDLMVEVLSYNAQPVILGSIVQTDEDAPVFGLPITNDLGSGDPVLINAVRMAIEHVGVWDTGGRSPLELLNGVGPFVYDVDDPSENNIYAVKAEML